MKFDPLNDYICVYSQLIDRNNILYFKPVGLTVGLTYYINFIKNKSNRKIYKKSMIESLGINYRTWLKIDTHKCNYDTYCCILENIYLEYNEYYEYLNVQKIKIKGLEISSKCKGRLKNVNRLYFRQVDNTNYLDIDTLDTITDSKNINGILADVTKRINFNKEENKDEL